MGQTAQDRRVSAVPPSSVTPQLTEGPSLVWESEKYARKVILGRAPSGMEIAEPSQSHERLDHQCSVPFLPQRSGPD